MDQTVKYIDITQRLISSEEAGTVTAHVLVNSTEDNRSIFCMKEHWTRAARMRTYLAAAAAAAMAAAADTRDPQRCNHEKSNLLTQASSSTAL